MSTATLPDIRRNNVAEASSQASAFTNDAIRLLDACGLAVRANWISRTVRDYLRHSQWHGIPFGAYLLARVQLNAEQRRRAMTDPELANLLSYSDPTGETAVRNVMRTV